MFYTSYKVIATLPSHLQLGKTKLRTRIAVRPIQAPRTFLPSSFKCKGGKWPETLIQRLCRRLGVFHFLDILDILDMEYLDRLWKSMEGVCLNPKMRKGLHR